MKETKTIPSIPGVTSTYDGINPLTQAREEQKKKAWIRNVVRCLGITEVEAQNHWEVINRHRNYAKQP